MTDVPGLLKDRCNIDASMTTVWRWHRKGKNDLRLAGSQFGRRVYTRWDFVLAFLKETALTLEEGVA